MSYLEAENLRLDQTEGLAVDLDETLALLLITQFSAFVLLFLFPCECKANPVCPPKQP
jgi:hypothetical protein